MSFLMPIFAVLGLLISLYIFTKKKQKQKIVCFLGTGCNAVVTSGYSAILIIPNEVLGIAYYFVVLTYCFIDINFPVIFADSSFNLLIIAATLAAAVFSIYLTYVQLFILKKLCEYCMTVNLINVLILLIVLL